MPNPLVAQGSLNKVRGSIVWSNFPALNVTAPYLGKAGITLTRAGESVMYFPTLTGAVTSQEPYLMIECEINLLKTQGLAAQYEAQMQTNAVLGDGTVRGDAITLGNFQIINCSIAGVRPLSFAGENPDYMVNIKGYYLINSSLFG